MRLVICVVVLGIVIGLAGCSKSEAPSANDPQTSESVQPEEKPLSEENFESGEIDGVLTPGEDQEETDADGGGETP